MDNEKTPLRRLSTPDDGRPRQSSGKERRSRSRGRGHSYGRSCERSRRSQHRSDSINRGRGDRSRSRLRDRSVSREERSSTQDRNRLQERESELLLERKRLRLLEDELEKEREQVQSSVSRNYANLSDQEREQTKRGECGRDPKNGAAPLYDNVELNSHKHSSSPAFSITEVMDLLVSLKQVQPQPSTSVAQVHTSGNSKNILPDFDPSSKNQRIDFWLKKVNECASVYGWDDRTTVHFAMQKLQGLAKTWYESLPSILFSWNEWQEKLVKAFPYEQNYGQSLEDMLRRKSRYNEPIEVYYYEKLALLNQCDIGGKRAVDCIIHGLSDKTMRSSALALRCAHPDQLLQFLMSNKEVPQGFVRSNYKLNIVAENKEQGPSNNLPRMVNRAVNHVIFCFNCKEKGHPYSMCPKPLVKCDKCGMVGHGPEACFRKTD